MRELVQRQKALRAQYQSNPQSALRQFEVRSQARQGNAEPASVVVPSGYPDTQFRTKAHTFIGGTSELPCPGDLFLAAMASCMEISLRIVATHLGIEIDELSVTARGKIDARGPMLMSPEVPVGFQDLECRAEIRTRTPLTSEQRLKLSQGTERCCSIMATIRSSNPVATHFEFK